MLVNNVTRMQASRQEFDTHRMATTLARQLGAQGFRPAVLDALLTGKRVQVEFSEAAFTRSVAANASPAHLETALQLVHLLFTHRRAPVPPCTPLQT